jgi:hypothetical protein
MRAKLIGFLVFCSIVLLMFLFDFARAKLFTIDIVSVVPSPIPADGATPVSVRVKLTRRNAPLEGHDLYIVSLDGGKFAANRIRTNSKGEVEYTYFPYRVSSTYPLHDIRFQIRDESNSIFLEVNAEEIFTVKAIEVKEFTQSKFNMDDIFGE